ncbi:MAG: SpoIIE family protein phosphatase [Planctomycetota bacterium]|jgi:serine phosphatase RsbU (regulator of sigma subunit)/anti-sigma regulatory factor (Ser/Thr protein kinase)
MTGPPNILLVDDEVQILETLKRQLRREPLVVLTASCGEEAIALLREHEIAVIICDQRMPGMTGAEVLAEALAISPQTVRITLTGFSDIKTAMAAINEGQTFMFLLKPWKRERLVEAVREGVKRYGLTEENRRLVAVTQDQNRQLQELNNRLVSYSKDQADLLQAGWKLQETILIDPPPKAMKGVRIAACSIPATELMGDFTFFHRYDEHLFDFVVGDVMGKGLTAALLAAALRGEFMSEWGRADAQGVDHYSPAAIVEAVAHSMGPRLVEMERFITLFFGRLDTRSRELRYVDCGSTKPIHLKVGGSRGKAVFLEGEDCPLGVVEAQAPMAEVRVELGEADQIVLYSDGIPEAEQGGQGPLYGTGRLQHFLSQRSSLSAYDINQHLLQEIRAWTGGASLLDDFTCVTFQLTGRRGTVVLQRNDVTWSMPAEVELVSSVDDVDRLHDLVDRSLRHCKPLEHQTRRREMIKLAVHEAFTNIVRHAYLGRTGLPVWFHAHCHADKLDVDLFDYGIGFEPEEVAAPDLSGAVDGGFGVFMIRQVADEIVYDVDRRARNHLALSFTLKRQEEDDDED